MANTRSKFNFISSSTTETGREKYDRLRQDGNIDGMDLVFIEDGSEFFYLDSNNVEHPIQTGGGIEHYESLSEIDMSKMEPGRFAAVKDTVTDKYKLYVSQEDGITLKMEEFLPGKTNEEILAIVKGITGDPSNLITTEKTNLTRAINELKLRADVNATNITKNAADITTNATKIATNTTNIATNAADIAQLDSDLDDVEAKIKKADWNQNDSSKWDYVANRTHYTKADGSVERLDNKYLQEDVKIDNSITVGTRDTDSTIGTKSISSGFRNNASGENSGAIGYKNEAKSSASFAAGYGNKANGLNATSAGRMNESTGRATFTSNESNTASGEQAFASGYNTTASGLYSHSEGYNTQANGNASHAEGIGTIAQGTGQHVVGKYNVVSATDIEVVGGGSSNTDRKNLRTLDATGNETVTGKITVGVGPTANMDVATKLYVDTQDNAIDIKIGTLSDLTTSAKTSTVAAINSLKTSTDTDIADKTISISSADGSGLKTYTVKQGTTVIGTIDVPKDFVVSSSEVVTNPDASHVGTFIKMVLQGQTTPMYINVGDLVDIYTAQQNAAQVQLAIDNANVISATLVDGGVSTAKIANGAITTSKIANGNVTTEKIADEAINTAKIADLSVTSGKIAAGAVTTARLDNEAVTTDKIAGSAVTTAKIADGNITEAKLGNLAVTTAKISNGAVTSDKLASNSVTTDKITNGTITTAKLDTTLQTAITKAGTAIQEITTGAQNGTIAVDGTDVAVKGYSALETQSNNNKSNIGTLANLTTTAKTDLVAAINEVKASADAGGTGNAVTMTTSTTATGFYKKFTLKQGTTTIGTIDVPDDIRVSSGVIEKNPTGKTAGQYLVLSFENETQKVYINVDELVDTYTAQSSATQVQLAVSATNEISATIVAGSIGSTELANNAITTAKVVDGAITKDKLSTALQSSIDSADKVGALTSLTTTAKNTLVAAINEVDAALDTAISDANTNHKVTLTTEDSSDNLLRKYILKQGSTQVGIINVAKDLVVSSGTVETNPTGQTAGTYIVLTLANASADKIYINVGDLIDTYTAQQSATEVQLTIDSNNVISAALVDGGIAKAKLATSVQTSLGKADTAVQSVTIGSANGTISVDGTDVSVKGLGTAAYKNEGDFDESGAADAVLGASTDASTANTVYGVKKYASDLETRLAVVEASGGGGGGTGSVTVDSALSTTSVNPVANKVITNKINSLLYAGSSSQGGAATSADKLNANAGSATQPIYFANGVPVATTYSLGKSVPADAEFTDTTYTTGTASKEGLTKLYTSTGTSTDGTMTRKAITDALADKIDTSKIGVASGVAELDSSGKIPESQLPSYVSDVIEYATKSAFPNAGESGKIYVATTTNLAYRWTGSGYSEIAGGIALGETSSTAYRGDRGAAAYAHAVTNKGSAFDSGLYKITTNAEGHVTAATAVVQSDITALDIATTDVATTTKNGLMSKTDKAKLDDLATVAITGDYDDLINTPELNVAVSGNTDSTYTLVASKKVDSVLTQGNYTDLINKPTTLDYVNILYPVGSVYVAGSADISPATQFGGTWTLIDKEFAPKYVALATAVTATDTSKATVSGGGIAISGHSILVTFRFKLEADQGGDGSVSLGTIDFTKIGLTTNSWGNHTYFTSTDDAGNGVAFGMVSGITGEVTIGDAIARTAWNASTVQNYLSSGSYVGYALTCLVRDYKTMADSFCNKWYWKRTA